MPCRILTFKLGFCSFLKERQSEAVKELAVICHSEIDVLGDKKLLSDMLARVKLAIVDYSF